MSQHPNPARLKKKLDREKRLRGTIAKDIEIITADFLARSKQARKSAKVALRRGNRAKHAKSCAVARVWSMAASHIADLGQ